MAEVELAVDDEIVVPAHPVYLLHVQVDIVSLDRPVFTGMIMFQKLDQEYILFKVV